MNFPHFYEMFPNIKYQKKLKQFREKLRYYVYLFLCKKESQALIKFLNQSEIFSQIFIEEPYRFNALLVTYCDKRFSAQTRLQAIITNLSHIQILLGQAKLSLLVEQKSLFITKLTENLNLYLNINDIDPFEGFFSFNITTNEKQRIYDATFTIWKNQLLITSIQGPNYTNSQETIKWATKELHGIRPMFMLIHVFRLFSQIWQLELIGIPHKSQAKYRLSARSKIRFNYDAFWQENNAVFANKYWQIPISVEQKALENIPSKKRSMYKKRYEMLDNLAQAVQNFLTN